MNLHSGKPRIAMVVSHLSPVFGLEKVALKVLALLRETYEVEVVCVGGDSSDLRECPDAKILGTPLRGVRRIRSIWRLRRASKDINADVVILVGTWVAIPWLFVGRTKRRRTFVWEHSMINARLSHSAQLRVLAFAARFLYKRADAIVAVSRPLERDISLLCDKSTVVTIPNPVDIEAYQVSQNYWQQKKWPPVRLLAVGSLTSVKAQHLAIRALAHLESSYCLTIVGSGPELNDLEELARNVGVASRVTFEGYLTPKEVRLRMRDAHLLVHTAVVETFGLVYVEAANAGLPVISTRSSVAEEMIPKYVPGWICSANPLSLAVQIRQGVSSEISESEARHAERQRRMEFSPASVKAQWQSLLDYGVVDDLVQN